MTKAPPATPTRGYAINQLLALDRHLAALLFNRQDVTISALCGLYRANARTLPPFNAVQRGFLRTVGNALEYFWPGHCQRAILSSIFTAQSTITLLNYPP